jgi:DNA gyrase subunit A
MIQFDLDKALARENVLNGLLIALADIDNIVAIIKGSDSPADAKKVLIAKYKFNDPQVDAILDMKLSRLCRLDGVKISDELAEITKFIGECNHLLSEPTALDEKLIELLNLVSQKFGDARRTQVTNVLGDEEEPEEIKEEDIAIVFTDMKSFHIKEKGKVAAVKKQTVLYTTNLGSLTLVTNAGKIYNIPLSKLKLNKEYKTADVADIGAEKPLLLIDTRTFNAYKSLTCVTKKGFIKKSHIGEYIARAKKGTAAIKLEEGDSLVSVILSSDDEDRVAIISSSDYYNCFPLSDVAYTGRLTKGVKAIKLAEKEEVKEAKWVGDNTYKITGRAVKGVKNA